MQCTAIKLNGKSCQAAALTGDSKCHFHSDVAREKKGGQHRQRADYLWQGK